MTLDGFLLARIAEDEAVAREAICRTRDGDTDRWQYDGEGVSSDPLGSVVAVGPWGGGLSNEGPHIARWDPARVLAECDAKRRIMLLANAARDDDDDLLDQVRVMTLRLLALPYADHPDYRDEWKP